MVRFFVLAFLALLVYLVLRTVIAAALGGFRGTPRAGTPRAIRNELVKDPVCQTYVPVQSAIARTAGRATYYFCSPTCAEKFQTPS